MAARRTRAVLGADYGVATTGVAGPDPAEGKPVGPVFVAVAGPGTGRVQAARPSRGPGRDPGRRAVLAVLRLLGEMLDLAVGEEADRSRVDRSGVRERATAGRDVGAAGYRWASMIRLEMLQRRRHDPASS